jgi:hypothetical protein
MSLFSKVFGGGDDPTRDWPSSQGPCPQVSLERQALEAFGGRLTFGDAVEAARFLGRPESYSAGKSTATLTYPRWALTLEFELGRFVHMSHTIARSHRDPPDSAVSTFEPIGTDRLPLTSRTTRDQLLQRFGEPSKTQSFDDETIFYYNAGPLMSEFQLDQDGHLYGWDLYLD